MISMSNNPTHKIKIMKGITTSIHEEIHDVEVKYNMKHVYFIMKRTSNEHKKKRVRHAISKTHRN